MDLVNFVGFGSESTSVSKSGVLSYTGRNETKRRRTVRFMGQEEGRTERGTTRKIDTATKPETPAKFGRSR